MIVLINRSAVAGGNRTPRLIVSPVERFLVHGKKNNIAICKIFYSKHRPAKELTKRHGRFFMLLPDDSSARGTGCLSAHSGGDRGFSWLRREVVRGCGHAH